MVDETTQSHLKAIAAAQPYPLLFATVSGAHLYGFPSADSDFDLRGVHVLPAREVLGLAPTRDTLEAERLEHGLELDLVTHDAGKFFRLMLKKNGYVLEQLHSPLIVTTTPAHEELRAIAAGCVTRYHAYHYLGFAETQWKLFAKETPPRVKPLLYVYRVLLTGLHLMRTAAIEANLVALNDESKLPFIDDLIARKRGGAEMETLSGTDLAFHETEVARLRTSLEAALETSTLREVPSQETKAALSDLLVRLRLESVPW